MTPVLLLAALLKATTLAETIADAGALLGARLERVGFEVECHGVVGVLLVQCIRSVLVALPDVRKSKRARIGKACFLAHLDKLAVNLAGLTLHAPVDPVDLDLEAGTDENRLGLLGPDNQAGGHEDRQ